VFVVAQNGLAAALSELAPRDLVPDITQAVAYERVVEAFYRHVTVIPVRYGCQFVDASEAIALLQQRHDEFEALLHELEDLGEMGIHILQEGPEAYPESDVWPAPLNPLSCMSGTAYLAAKRERYLGSDQAALARRRSVEELCDSLAGLYVRRKVEFPDFTKSGLLSLYFLVSRSSVESFRGAARGLRANNSLKLLLSGPWPPYNFV